MSKQHNYRDRFQAAGAGKVTSSLPYVDMPATYTACVIVVDRERTREREREREIKLKYIRKTTGM